MKRLVLISPYCDGTDVGEIHWVYQWVSQLAARYEVTLLTMERPGRQPLAEQLPDIHLVTWPEPSWVCRHERLNAMMKPAYPWFYGRAKEWLLANREHIGLVHQLGPVALRYPCPAHALDVPYVIGPQAGSLKTPEVLRNDGRIDAWYARLRGLDHWRLKNDPWLKRSYENAAAVIGVADYVREHLGQLRLQRFVTESEIAISSLEMRRDYAGRGLRSLLHVGRGVRTKGLVDAIRCVDRLRHEYPDIRLVSAGHGPEIDRCRGIVAALGLQANVDFVGQVSRERIEALYSEADIFLFPSFREPSGSVVLEAMRHGLPVIGADYGGPGHVIDQSCGVSVLPSRPEQFADNLAEAVTGLIRSPHYCQVLSDGARNRAAALGLWENKLDRIDALYRDVLGKAISTNARAKAA
tara:strand:- start:62 stop:1291 length:1230 start_codon:yes stop_codon:yes gene_type:complete